MIIESDSTDETSIITHTAFEYFLNVKRISVTAKTNSETAITARIASGFTHS